MNKQDIQTVLEVLANLHDKTSPVCFEAYGDSIDEAYANAHKAIAILTAALAEPEGEPSTVLRLIDTIKYLVGIAERGEGRKARDDELPEQFVLGYVKRLEAALAEPSEADDTICPTCGEDGGTSCGMPNCGLLIGESDVEPQNEPVAWQLGHRFYTSLKDAEYAWRNDCAFLGTSYVPEPLFTHPASKPEPSEPVAWTESAIDEYLSGYSLCGDDGDYTPTDDEKFVIKDAIIGFMSATPDCWDTAAYPALEDAIIEAKAWEHCTNEDCAHPATSKPAPLPELTREELLGAIARGWCTERNAYKTMDVELAEDIAEAVWEKLE